MNLSTGDMSREDFEDENRFDQAMSSVLMATSVLIWVAFWGAIWLASVIYVALRGHE